MKYIGRFAPSPSGPLHFGSLVAALASYLDAKAHRGQWLVRMEDIDPPREQAGAATLILHCLEQHGLEWDDFSVSNPTLYQSSRHEAYQQALQTLQEQQLIYPCSCGRQQLRAMENNVYNGHCRELTLAADTPTSLRLNIAAAISAHDKVTRHINFHDLFQGNQQEDIQLGGDFIIHRKDCLFAYQLAVVIDDIFQGITHVVRGVDLLSTTPRQIFLFQLFGAAPPIYGHFPVVCNELGDKLSKQTKALPVDNQHAPQNLLKALQFLLPHAPNDLGSCTDIIQWGVQHWQRSAVII